MPNKYIIRSGVSKKTFKKAVGDLYKKRLIVLEDDSIRLVKNNYLIKLLHENMKEFFYI